MTKFNKVIIEDIYKTSEKFSRVKIFFAECSHEYLETAKLAQQFDNLAGYVSKLNRKPVIGCFGAFDSGKSTFLNTILGKQVLPERYQPATSVVTLVMHIDDKPPSLVGKVAIFKKGFFAHMIYSKEDIEAYLVADGNEELLQKLGIHNYDEELGSEAYAAIVFEDCDILKNMWLLDTPGDFNSTDEEDTQKALTGLEMADSIVYLSSHNGFLSGTELSYAIDVLRHKPPVTSSRPLDHILFIQSHCHSEIPEESIIQSKEIAFKRLQKQLNQTIFEIWLEDKAIDALPSPKQLADRTYPFWRENEKYKARLLQEILKIVEHLGLQNEERINKALTSSNDISKNLVKSNILILENKKIETTAQRIQSVNDQVAKFRSQVQQKEEAFKKLIIDCDEYQLEALSKIKTDYENLVSINNIEQTIIDVYPDKKEEAKKEIGSYIGQLIQILVEQSIKKSSEHINAQTNKLLDEWQAIVPNLDATNLSSTGNENFSLGFNSKAVFASGLIGIGSLGAMALFVSSTIASNLGAYILVAHVGGFLTTAGVISSPTVLTSVVAAIGGPITIGIVLAGAIGYLAYKWINKKTWQRLLAESAHKAIIKADPFKAIESSMDTFWTNTKKAVNIVLMN